MNAATATAMQPPQSPAPIIKWVGGKRQLLPTLLPLVPPTFGAYHEPFVGGGALFFALRAEGRAASAVISDVNEDLVTLYQAVRDEPARVISSLRELADLHDPANPGPAYYKVRSRFNLGVELPAQTAAEFIYLNRTGFNGLCRYNSKGGFNVPVGAYKNPLICDEPAIWAASGALTCTDIRAQDYSKAMGAAPGDFVYFDPPYAPVSDTANFTGYAAGGFGESEQRRLADICDVLTGRGVYWIASNSSAPLIFEIYGEVAARHPSVRIMRVPARRSINSKGTARGAVDEVIVGNFGAWMED